MHAAIGPQQATLLVVGGDPAWRVLAVLRGERGGVVALGTPDAEVGGRVLLDREATPPVVLGLGHQAHHRVEVELVEVAGVEAPAPLAALHDALADVERERHLHAQLAQKAAVKAASRREREPERHERAAGRGRPPQLGPDGIAAGPRKLRSRRGLEGVALAPVREREQAVGGRERARVGDVVAASVPRGALEQRGEKRRERVVLHQRLGARLEPADAAMALGVERDLRRARVHHEAVGVAHLELLVLHRPLLLPQAVDVVGPGRPRNVVDADVGEPALHLVGRAALGAEEERPARPDVVVPRAAAHLLAVEVESHLRALEDARDAVPGIRPQPASAEVGPQAAGLQPEHRVAVGIDLDAIALAALIDDALRMAERGLGQLDPHVHRHGVCHSEGGAVGDADVAAGAVEADGAPPRPWAARGGADGCAVRAPATAVLHQRLVAVVEGPHPHGPGGISRPQRGGCEGQDEGDAAEDRRNAHRLISPRPMGRRCRACGGASRSSASGR